MLSVLLGFVSIKDTTQALNIIMLSFMSIRDCTQAQNIIMLCFAFSYCYAERHYAEFRQHNGH
jgi:hypothetical protein